MVKLKFNEENDELEVVEGTLEERYYCVGIIGFGDVVYCYDAACCRFEDAEGVLMDDLNYFDDVELIPVKIEHDLEEV